MLDLKGRCTIVIVTHNMAQARRASAESILVLMGRLVAHAPTGELFLNPKNPKTLEYIEGRHGQGQALRLHAPDLPSPSHRRSSITVATRTPQRTPKSPDVRALQALSNHSWSASPGGDRSASFRPV